MVSAGGGAAAILHHQAKSGANEKLCFAGAAGGGATVIQHHQPKSGSNEKLCFAGAGASSLQRYMQSIARIREDKSGNFWFEALCREFDEPFKPFVIRKAPPPP